MPEIAVLQRMHIIDRDEGHQIDVFDEGAHHLSMPPGHGGVEHGEGPITVLSHELGDGEARRAL